MTHLICRLFDHAPDVYPGRHCSPVYGKVEGGHTDNLGSSHYRLIMVCRRCGERYEAGKFHGDSIRKDAAREERDMLRIEVLEAFRKVGEP